MTSIRNPPRCFFPALASFKKPTSNVQAVQNTYGSTSRRLESLGHRALSQWFEAEGTDAMPLLRAAWAVALRAYTGADHVCFHVHGQEDRPYEAHITGSAVVRRLLRNESDAVGGCTCRGIETNAGVWEQVSNTCVFIARDAVQTSNILREERYSHALLSDEQGRAVANTLHQTILEIIRKTGETVDDMDVCSDEDIRRMCSWNAPFGMQLMQEQCAYNIIAQRCSATPDATAISAWDGEMTFGELDRRSSLLALRLLELGVGPEEVVPVYFEKSKWAVVAIVAVVKTGGAFVLMDANFSMKTLHLVCHKVDAHVIVSSRECQPTAQGLVEQVVCLDSSWADPESLPRLPQPRCTPSSALYAAFTSGSTKGPKCVIMENRACCETTLKTAPALGLSGKTRRLQFSSYAFTMSVREILSMLFLGGCLCIPSERDRINDIAGFINRHRVTFANFCPSISRIPSPDSVPSLRTLMVGGESPDPRFIKLWASKVRLILGFGATETAGITLMVGNCLPGHDPRNLGKACDSRLWVVNMDNHDRLVPVGAVGELVLQGTGLGRHYLKNSQDTASQFPDALEWQSRLVDGPTPDCGRLYKTGDLVRYTSDGSLIYVGRKAQVVKANGQLIDVHEIENCLKSCREAQKLQISCVAVIPAKSSMDGHCTTKLVAFIGGSRLSRDRSILVDRDGALEVPRDKCWQTVSTIRQELSMKLPPNLVPANFIFMQDLPRKLSGKVDRNALLERAPRCHTAHEHWKKYNPEQQSQSLHHISVKADVTICSPGKARQLNTMKCIVADLLGLEPGNIHPSTNIFAAGIDSMKAMDVVAAARREGVRITITNLYDHPVLSDLVAVCHEPTPARKLVRRQENAPDAREHTTAHEELCMVLPPHISENVHEIVHTTAFQSWSLHNMNYRYLSIPLLKACQALVDQHSSLRTVFLTLTKNGRQEIVQVVLKRMSVGFQYLSADSLDQHCRDDSAGLATPPTNGLPLLQVQIVALPDGTNTLLIRHVHAQMDGLSWAIISQDLSASYNGQSLAPTTPFSVHARVARHSSGPEAYRIWRKLLADSSMTRLDSQSSNIAKVTPRPPTAEQGTVDSPRLITSSKQVAHVKLPAEFTLATIVKAAWALTLARIFPDAAPRDIVFGQVVNGRLLGIPHEDRIVGPCLNIIPVRVRVCGTLTKRALLSQVQQQHRDTIECWNTEYDQIVRNCTSWPPGTRFGSFVRCQNFDTHPICRLGDTPCQMQQITTPNQPCETANVCVAPFASILDVSIAVSSHVMCQKEADSTVGILCDMIMDLLTGVVKE
ncbi:acetyl-CoA synthetase-like protein [Aspergillus novofumigatus IBT 16806]|uniref:Acetyl-CoA synthetase-like protein n=1 Tax=Aspergillus novofumigatus (strain IBT 16806) TaxID=1392255 RepID=A0A2I1CCS8_ASPN1|nr:acetyl-CoA synthetase-like protein [Aspergillus novofumigatus IBT 16806]PKX95422.1 acetyl-CoA synthetase-like protein [Aspergillus novofumigatus IBT 16806]